jgi:hypothetical protein
MLPDATNSCEKGVKLPITASQKWLNVQPRHTMHRVMAWPDFFLYISAKANYKTFKSSQASTRQDMEYQELGSF